jgi:hypothetical protein
MNLHTLNLWAVLVAAASALVLGGLWYSPLAFGTVWKKANRFASDPPGARGQGICNGVCAEPGHGSQPGDVSERSQDEPGLGSNCRLSCRFGGIVSLFENRPWSYVLVNGGYMTAALVLMGVILGAWR